ncbi:Fic family protein [Leifsonia sp. McL0607]|uniref:Fic family protein n=1 Tax=Leifsonia sp. McL0607 TaxID=3415672 RepID=UPI003CEAB7E6
MEAITYPRFEFDSELSNAIISLERARAELDHGTTPPIVFFQLKELFELLTSIMSARIEGNRTSLLDAVTGAMEGRSSDTAPTEGVSEILNIQRGMAFIEAHANDGPLTHNFVRELHRIVVAGLHREGDLTPGAYRLGEVTISQAQHRPPFPTDVFSDMSQLLDLANEVVEPHKQLLQSAIVHHRFLWIHPFGNGNGRVSRLLTYAMLIRQGFVSTTSYRPINPTAVFGADRSGYYDNLAQADRLDNDGLIAWCTFVLEGLNTDLDRLRSLRDNSFVTKGLLHPAIERLHDSGRVTTRERDALRIVADRSIVKAGELESAFPGSASTRSQAIKRLWDRGLLAHAEGPRSYRLVFAPSELTLHLIYQLDRAGFLPSILKDDLV